MPLQAWLSVDMGECAENAEEKIHTVRIVTLGTRSALVPSMKTIIAAAHASVVIIDDDPDYSTIVGHMLRREGSSVRCFGSAEEGLEYFKHLSRLPEAVLLDFSLPGMNGAEFLLHLRKMDTRFAGIPVILSSAEDDLDEKTQFLNVTKVIKKPISPFALYGEIRSIRRAQRQVV